MKAKENHIDSGFKVERYVPSKEYEWNEFVSKSKNATFLFDRNFMEYHKDRFEDFSLMAYKNGKLIALLPANRVGNEVHSHQGLTYGSLLLPFNIKFTEVSDLFDAILAFLKTAGVKTFNIKMIPEFYAKQASNELLYVMAIKNAQLQRRDMVLAVDYSKPINIHKTKLKHYKRASDLRIVYTQDFADFWENVLEPRLKMKHQAKPVHTLDEIRILHETFPDKIWQYSVYEGDSIVAGVTLFETETVIKSQYGATTERGETLRALEYVFIYLIEKFKTEGKRYFSMGTVHDSSELGYNRGMLKQKEELGCSMFVQDNYTLTIQ